MTAKLKTRLRRLETAKKPTRQDIHVHYKDGRDFDPRRDCEKCRAMTDAEFAAMDSNPDILVIIVEYEDEPGGDTI